jgi:hypothetical protein
MAQIAVLALFLMLSIFAAIRFREKQPSNQSKSQIQAI